MKTRNFPGRKNARRMSALSRLLKTRHRLILRYGENITQKQKDTIRRIDAEVETLYGRIVDQQSALSIRTKKKRG